MSEHASGIIKQILACMEGWHSIMAVRVWLHQGGADHTLSEVIMLLSAEKEGIDMKKAAAFLQSAINGTSLGHYDVLEMIKTSWVAVMADDEWEFV